MLFMTCSFGFVFFVALVVGIGAEVLRKVPVDTVFLLPVPREVKGQIFSLKASAHTYANWIWKELVPGVVVGYLGYLLLWFMLAMAVIMEGGAR